MKGKRYLLKILMIGWITGVPAMSGAQQYDCNCDVNDIAYVNFLQNLLISRQYENPIPAYRGEQYFNVWAPGNILLENTETITGMMIRYDKFMDELLWLRQSDFQTGVVNKSIVQGFEIFDQDNRQIGLFVKKRIKPFSMDSLNVYLHVLAEGPFSLYAYRNLVRAVSESRTVDNTSYYVFVSPARYYTVQLRRKSLYSVPGIDKIRMRSIIRSNRLKVRNEADFILAVSLYNQAEP